MNPALWVLQALLSVAVLFAGALKLASSKAELVERVMGWAEDFSTRSVKLIGLAEVLGAIGIVAPRATGIAPVLTPVAAVCLCAIMIGGAAVHVRRKENPAPPIVLGAIAVVVAVGRFALV
jgi:hypothetical protein